jgi:O-antigen/teichoic acid export membrane protein
MSMTSVVLFGMGYAKAVLALGGLFGCALFPRAVVESTQGVLRGRHRLGSFLALEVLQGAVLLALGVALLFAGKGLPGVVWAELGAAICTAGAALWMLPRSSCRVTGIRVPWQKMIRRTFVFNLWPILVNLYDRFDVILLSKLVGEGVAGIYAIPYRAFGTFQILPYGIMGSSLPGLSVGAWDEPRRQGFHRLLGSLFGLAVFSVLATMLFADQAVRVFLGPAYHESALAMKILIWALIPAFLNNAMNTLLLARNQERALMRTACICLAANLSANLILIPRFSFVAAAGTTIFTEFVLFAQNAFLMRPLLGAWVWPRGWVRTSVAFAAIYAMASLGLGRSPLPRVGLSLAGVGMFGFLLFYMDVIPILRIKTAFEGIWS